MNYVLCDAHRFEEEKRRPVYNAILHKKEIVRFYPSVGVNSNRVWDFIKGSEENVIPEEQSRLNMHMFTLI